MESISEEEIASINSFMETFRRGKVENAKKSLRSTITSWINSQLSYAAAFFQRSACIPCILFDALVNERHRYEILLTTENNFMVSIQRVTGQTHKAQF